LSVSQPGVESLSHCPHFGTLDKNGSIFTDSGNGVFGVLESNESKLLLIRCSIVDKAKSHAVWRDTVSDVLDDIFDECQRSSKRLLVVMVDRVDYEY